MATDISRMADALCEMEDKVAELQYKLQRVDKYLDKHSMRVKGGTLDGSVVVFVDGLRRALDKPK